MGPTLDPWHCQTACVVPSVSSEPVTCSLDTGSCRALKAMAGGRPVFVSAAVSGPHELRFPGDVTCVSSNDASRRGVSLLTVEDSAERVSAERVSAGAKSCVCEPFPVPTST